MRLTVVGSGGGTGTSEEISSGYLITQGDAALLIECGPGVATQIRRYLSPADLQGVVISHMHFDNFYDLLALAVVRYAAIEDILTADYSVEVGRRRIERLPVYLPPGGVEYMEKMIAALSDGSPYPHPRLRLALDTALALHTYDAGAQITVGPFTVYPIGPVAHGPGPCFGLRITNGTATIAYSGDSGMSDVLVTLAKEADLFLCEATAITNRVHTDGRHLAADDAGDIAARAGARQLVLTHLIKFSLAWTNNIIEAARQHYHGPIYIARRGAVFSASLLSLPR